MCRKVRRRRRFTKSECLDNLRNLGKRFLSRITAFKFTQLVLASGGMSLHVWQPFYRTITENTLVPGVLGAFGVISGILLIGHLFNFTAPPRLNVTFSIVGFLCYGCCMVSVMDTVNHEEDARSWHFLLGKGIVCFAGLAIHLLEVLHAFLTRDKRPLSLRSVPPSQTISQTESYQPA